MYAKYNIFIAKFFISHFRQLRSFFIFVEESIWQKNSEFITDFINLFKFLFKRRDKSALSLVKVPDRK